MADDAYRYELLADEQRRQIVDSRLAQYEAEHYGHALNRRALEQATDLPPDERARQLEQLDRVLESLEHSIAIHRDERARLNGGASA